MYYFIEQQQQQKEMCRSWWVEKKHLADKRNCYPEVYSNSNNHSSPLWWAENHRHHAQRCELQQQKSRSGSSPAAKISNLRLSWAWTHSTRQIRKQISSFLFQNVLRSLILFVCAELTLVDPNPETCIDAGFNPGHLMRPENTAGFNLID